MKKTATLIFIALLYAFHATAQPEWMFFHASDGVSDMQAHDAHIWASSGSGLHKINLTTGERTVFNSSNSDMPGHVSDDIAVDGIGAVWMAGDFDTKNLTRFDGTNWQTWTEINGYSIQGILDILPGAGERVWIYGYVTQASLSFYENGSFTTVPPPTDWLFMGGTRSSIAITSNQHVWILLRDTAFENFRLGEFDGTNWTLHDIGNNAYDSRLHADSQNNLHLLDGDLDGSTILKYDGQTWTEISAPFIINDFNNSLRPMYTDAQGNLWVGLWNNTFAHYDGQTWTTINLADLGLTGGHPDGLTIDDNGKWWFIYAKDFPNTNIKSLYSYDGTVIEAVNLSNSRIKTNYLNTLLIDPQQNKWADSYDELLKFDGSKWEAHNSPPYPSNYYLPLNAADKWGNLWFSGIDGFIGRYDGLAFTKIDVVSSDGMPLNFAKNIVAAKDGTVYFATGGGEIIKIKNGEISYIDSMMYTDIIFGISYPDYCFYVGLSASDQLWSIGYNALYRLDGDNWTEIPLWEQGPESADEFVLDPQGRVWVRYGIGSPGEGYPYQIYDGNGWQFFDVPFENRTFPAWDSQNNLWMGGTSGLYKYDGSNWTNYNIYNSELPSNFVRDLKIDRNDNIWLALENAGLAVFNENGIQDINAQQLPALSGTIYRDLDADQQNGLDDLPLAFQKTLLLPDSVITFSSFVGSFQYQLPEGDYEVQYLPAPNWHTEAGSPSNYLALLGPSGLGGLDFRISPDMEIRDAEVSLTGSFPRCNFEVSYWLNWRNTGTMAEDGNVHLSLDPLVEFIWSYPPPSTTNGNLLTWSFEDLLPTESRQFYLQLKMPDETATDSSIVFTSTIERWDAAAGFVPLDTSMLEQTILCAFDPNDKLAQPTGETQDGQSLLADALDYTIRFQNTGNDTAFTIVLRDTLDPQFDPNTFELIAASHPMTTRLQRNGALEFRFANILLPDSTTNEPASHGFVQYRIQIRLGAGNFAEVTNKAYIYFDLNQPIVTNTTVNVLVDDFTATRENHKARFDLTISPNPSSISTQVALTIPLAEVFQLKVMDAMGRVQQTQQVSGARPTVLDIQVLTSGVYLIVLENEGKYGVGKLVKP